MLATNGALYGKGIFTTITIVACQPFLWDKHWKRLANNAATVGIDISAHSKMATKDALSRSISESGLENGRARITFLDESPSPIWPAEAPGKTSLLIATAGRRPLPENFRLTLSPYTINSRSPLAGIKSCNYLEKLMAMDEARGRGFDEAVQVNERGSVTSACMANIFWLKNSVLYTPSLTTGCLPGTTREYILEDLECHEVEAGIEELDSADAIYLTSAGLGIASVAEYNGRHLPNPPHRISQLLTSNL